MALTALAQTLGWLGDLIAVHLYRDDAPLPMRRRISFDGDGLDVQDDPVGEVSRISLTAAGGGDSGTVPSPSVANTLLRSIDGSTTTWGTLVNAMVDAAAAIAGTKITPDFGTQNIVSTGYMRVGGATPATVTQGIGLPNAKGVSARNVGNTQNANLIQLSASNIVVIGDVAQSSGVAVVDSNTDQIALAGGEFEVTLGGVAAITHDGTAISVNVAGVEVIASDGTDIQLRNDDGAGLKLGVDLAELQLSSLPRASFKAGEQTYNLSLIQVFETSFSQSVNAGATSDIFVYPTAGVTGEYIVECYVVARDTTTDRAGYVRRAVYKVTAGTLALVGAVDASLDRENDATWDVTLGVSGTNIRMQGVADAANATIFAGFVRIIIRQ